jgi:preprotein translocase subunit SecD
VVHGPAGRADRGRRAEARLTRLGPIDRTRLVAILAAVAVALVVLGCAPLGPSASSSAAGETVRRFRVTSSVRALTGPDLTRLAQDAQLALEAAGIPEPHAVATTDGLEIHLAAPAAQADDILRRLLLAEGSMRVLDPGDAIPEDGTPVDATWPVLMDGSKIDGTTVHLERDDQGLRVVFGVRPEAANSFSAWTNEHIGQAFVVALDDKVLSAPVIQSAIRLEDMAISTPEDEDAIRLAAVLRQAGGVTLLPLGG